MDLKVFFTVFSTIFVAEIADKTQIATMLYASDNQHSKLLVFLGAACALVVTSAIGVFAGSVLSSFINEKVMAKVAGAAFVVVGVWTFFRG